MQYFELRPRFSPHFNISLVDTGVGYATVRVDFVYYLELFTGHDPADFSGEATVQIGSVYDTITQAYSSSPELLIYYDVTLETDVAHAGYFNLSDWNFGPSISCDFDLTVLSLDRRFYTGTNDFNVVFGTSDDNSISGMSGDDALDGQAGNDTLDGGSGEDKLFGDTGHDRLTGGTGNDTLEGGTGSDVASYWSATGGTHVDLRLTSDQDIGGGQGTDRLRGIENLEGSAFSDVLVGDSAANQIAGYAGNDHLIGNGDIDALSGGDGNDTLNGGTGADRMVGGTGSDVFVVDNAKDLVIEAAIQGTDRINASVSYTLAANVENLILTGNAKINGAGNGLANTITGNTGSNILWGGAGNDTLNGGAGNDTLNGGTGADRMVGGTGSDVFVFKALSDSQAQASGRETILDFSRSQRDIIDVSAIDANTNRTGNQDFNYLGNSAFTGQAGDLSARIVAGGTLVSGDVNGDRIADFALLLDDRLALTANSFIL